MVSFPQYTRYTLRSRGIENYSSECCNLFADRRLSKLILLSAEICLSFFFSCCFFLLNQSRAFQQLMVIRVLSKKGFHFLYAHMIYARWANRIEIVFPKAVPFFYVLYPADIAHFISTNRYLCRVYGWWRSVEEKYRSLHVLMLLVDRASNFNVFQWKFSKAATFASYVLTFWNFIFKFNYLRAFQRRLSFQRLFAWSGQRSAGLTTLHFTFLVISSARQCVRF